jgi:hypothetical protein
MGRGRHDSIRLRVADEVEKWILTRRSSENSLRSSFRPRVTEVVRLRSCFASRSNYYAQDDNLIERDEKFKLLLRVAVGQEVRRRRERVELCIIRQRSGEFLRFAQVGVPAGYRDVEHPLMTFFFRFYQTLIPQRH